MARSIPDMIGRRFGRLTVEAAAPKAPDGKARWLVRCECGGAKEVRHSNLPRSVSCGCDLFDRNSAAHTVHGHGRKGKRTSEYNTWLGMIARCHNLNSKDYGRYGGRGIKVCPEWHGPEGFQRFIDHIGPKPGPGYSVDRSDNSRGYEPGNVSWSTPNGQAINRRSSRVLQYQGKSQTIAAWAREIGVSQAVISLRLKAGWQVARALTEPAGPTGPKPKKERSLP